MNRETIEQILNPTEKVSKRVDEFRNTDSDPDKCARKYREHNASESIPLIDDLTVEEIEHLLGLNRCKDCPNANANEGYPKHVIDETNAQGFSDISGRVIFNCHMKVNGHQEQFDPKLSPKCACIGRLSDALNRLDNKH